MEPLTIYDQSGQPLAILDTADKIGYTLQHNDLWTASFTLASGDPGNRWCAAHNLVKLPDGPRKTGLYRIVGTPSGEETAMGGRRTYNLEHVMATLLDDVLFGYHELGGTGVYTRDVIEYILARQTVARWQLGVCEFSDQFQYHFENVSLLSALLSLGEVLTEEYTWDFDTETDPWTVNLRHADSSAGCGIYYGRNMVSIQKSMDASALITRLYPLGYGEGVNQLTIKEVNEGVPYIEADTVNTWGVKCSVWTDTRIQDATTLKAKARQILEGYKNPYISYTAKAVDLYRETGQSWDDFMPGKLVTVMDGEHDIDFDARIVSINKRDVNGDPGNIEITIANTPRDAADSINTLADRVGIGELYSQGATNLFAIPFADNADENHPAKFRVYIPRDMVRINKMLLSWQITAFRAYSTGAASGGGENKTSESGGGAMPTTSKTTEVEQTSEDGGKTTITQLAREVADAGTNTLGQTGGPYKNGSGDGIYMGSTNGKGLTTKSDGRHHHSMDHYHTVNSHSHTVDSHSHGMTHGHTQPKHAHSFTSDAIDWQHWHDAQGGSSSYTGSVPAGKYADLKATGNTDANNPSTYNYVGNTDAASPSTDAASPSTSGAKESGSDRNTTGDAGDHTHEITEHSHGMNHFHYLSNLRIPEFDIDIPAHSHSVKIPGHNHTVEIEAHTHVVILPDHTHDIVYGIYEGTRASSVTINVDGTDVPAAEITSREIDVIGYLSKDTNGKIRRGAWHEIQIVPDGLTRIEANLTAQVFVQSVGGGDY